MLHCGAPPLFLNSSRLAYVNAGGTHSEGHLQRLTPGWGLLTSRGVQRAWASKHVLHQRACHGCCCHSLHLCLLWQLRDGREWVVLSSEGRSGGAVGLVRRWTKRGGCAERIAFDCGMCCERLQSGVGR
eukprot:scaffold136895_cov17-Tisochrysis_lutea.AAC.2